MTVVQYDPGALTRADRGGFAADWLLDPAEIANRIGGTDFVPKALRNNPAAITAALLYGAEVGLGRMQSLAKIAVIDGRPSLAAEAQRALILAAGHDLWVEESTITRCTIAGRRKGSELTSRVTWTLDDAKRAKIAGRANWQAYPRQMLLARASAELARSIFADVIGGLAATEELEDVDVDITGAPELEQGPEPPRPATRRRSRRVGTTAGSSPAAPQTPAEPEPSPEPSPEPEPAQSTEPTGETPAPAPETPLGGDQTPTEPAEPDAPNRAQMGLLFALFEEKGHAERDDRLAFSERVLERRITSAKDLSSLDVTRIIDALKAEPTPAAPAAAPAPTGPEQAAPAPAESSTLPDDEQAVLDALKDELDATEVPRGPGDFPDGY